MADRRGPTLDQQTDQARLRVTIVEDLDLKHFPLDGYRRGEYLRRALKAGFEVADLAVAHDVSKKTIYNALDREGVERARPPTTGLARRLHEAAPEHV